MSSSELRFPGALAACLCAALAGGCALAEVTIPLGHEVLVVQGVLTLDPAAPAQSIVVERSLTGTVLVPDQDSVRGVLPPLPVSGAVVRVTRDDSMQVTFGESDTLGIYTLDSSLARPFIQAGRRYVLYVRVPDGREVHGTMRMPDFPAVSGVPPDGATFDRDRDTLNVTWSGGGSTKGVFVQVRPRDIQRRLTLFLFTDSARFRLAGSMPLPLVSDSSPPTVWVPGTRQTFTVAAVDTNLFDFARSGNNPFTGDGFLNRLEGALGVFGGVAPVNRTFQVVGTVDHPWEGRYSLEGSVFGDTLLGELRLFVTRDLPEPVLVAALMESPGGPALRAEVVGRVEAGVLTVTLLRDPPGPVVSRERVRLEGVFHPDSVTSGTISAQAGVVAGPFRLERLGGPP